MLAVVVAHLAEADVAAVPAVGQDRPQGVVAWVHAAGHVIGAVIDAPGVVGPAGVEVVVADALAVEVQVEDPQRGGVERGAADGFVDLERGPQVGRRGQDQLLGLAFASAAGAVADKASRGLSKPIHSAFQSEGFSSPIDQEAGVLQSEGLPSLSQTLTFQ